MEEAKRKRKQAMNNVEEEDQRWKKPWEEQTCVPEPNQGGENKAQNESDENNSKKN